MDLQIKTTGHTYSLHRLVVGNDVTVSWVPYSITAHLGEDHTRGNLVRLQTDDEIKAK